MVDMAYYLVRAKALPHKLAELQTRLERGEIRTMQPFGKALDYSLRNARMEGEWLVWEEEDYCRPPLAMERAAVLDDYFTDLAVERVEKSEGWKRLEDLPRLWEVR
jgi:hypothetical protein